MILFTKYGLTFKISKQWPNLRDSLITHTNLARRVTFFSKMAFCECRRVWRVLAKLLMNVGESGKSSQNFMANVACPNIFQFLGILYLPDLLNLQNLPNSRHYSEIQKCRDLCSISCNQFFFFKLTWKSVCH
jgi:hypothetical protein